MRLVKLYAGGMAQRLCLLALAACGRVGFDPAGTDSGVGVAAITCPANYVPVDPLPGYTTTPFCLAKYEMKDIAGVATSTPTGCPRSSRSARRGSSTPASLVPSAPNYAGKSAISCHENPLLRPGACMRAAARTIPTAGERGPARGARRISPRWGGREAEGAGLENRYTRQGIRGSNPLPTA